MNATLSGTKDHMTAGWPLGVRWSGLVWPCLLIVINELPAAGIQISRIGEASVLREAILMITRREFTALVGVVLGAPSVLLEAWGSTSPTAATPAPKSTAPANMQMVGAHEDVVRLYIEEVERVPRLSEAEEVEQRERAACGDQVATQRLLEAHLQHVVLIARDYADRGLDLLDLIQEGNMGLIRAATKLNEIPPGMTFRDFATVSIRQSIEEGLSRG